jgi:nitronate monooxygenase
VRTTIFDVVRRLDWPSHYTGRALANEFSRRWHGHEGELAAAPEAVRTHYAEATAAADYKTAVVFTGEGIDMIRAVEPAAEIVARVVAEAERALARRFD